MLNWLSPAIRRPEHIRNPPEKVYPESAEQQQQQQQPEHQQQQPEHNQQQQQQQQQHQQQQQQQEKLFIDDPLDPEIVARRTAARISFFEIKELEGLERKELKIIKEKIGKEIRDLCREDLDEYVDCMSSRTITFLRCRRFAQQVHRCIKKYETPEFVARRIEELRKEREASGVSLLRRRERQKYNKFMNDSEGRGWLPPPAEAAKP